jgi:hypothetical protein
VDTLGAKVLTILAQTPPMSSITSTPGFPHPGPFSSPCSLFLVFTLPSLPWPLCQLLWYLVLPLCPPTQNLRVRSSGGTEFFTRSATKFKGARAQKFMFVDGDRAVCGSYR